METELTGLDDLRDWLDSQGFRAYKDGLNARENLCNWYACRKVKADCRECGFIFEYEPRVVE